MLQQVFLLPVPIVPGNFRLRPVIGVAHQAGEFAPDAQFIAFHREDAAEAGDGGSELEGGLDVLRAVDAVADQRGGGVGKGAALRNHGGQVALPQAERVAHGAGGRADSERGIRRGDVEGQPGGNGVLAGVDADGDFAVGDDVNIAAVLDDGFTAAGGDAASAASWARVPATAAIGPTPTASAARAISRATSGASGSSAIGISVVRKSGCRRIYSSSKVYWRTCSVVTASKQSHAMRRLLSR